MANLNEHTGATLRTKVPNDAYKDGWDRIFGSQSEIKRTQIEYERTQNVGSSEQLPTNRNE